MAISLSRLVVDVLATYRLTKLVIDDELTADLREKAFEHLNPDGKIAYLLTCPWCVSFWAGLTIFSLRQYAPEQLTDTLNGALAASAASGLIYENT